MSLNLDVAVSYESEEILEFIFDDTKDELIIPPIIENGFSHAPTDRRPNVGAGFEHVDRIPCFVEEHWAVIQSNSIAGVNKVIVILGHDVKIISESWLCLRDDISNEAKEKAKRLFSAYDQSIHGTDVRQYVNSQLDETLSEDIFNLETAVKISKVYSNPANHQKIEINIEQRNLLQILFNKVSGDPVSCTVNLIVGDDRNTFQDWSRDEKCTIDKIDERLLLDKIEPPKLENVKEVKPGTSDAAVGGAIDFFLAQIIPSQCGEMKRKEFKLLTLAEFPEFKLGWTYIRIKLGCVHITIKIPIIRIRLSKIIFYVYYSLPKDVGPTALLIAETCAKRSALGAAVIGLVLWNIAAAGAAFESLFKRCLEREVLSCIHPGIMTMKEAGDWNPPE